MKLISIILLLICWLKCFPQTMELRGGQSLMPGIYSSLRYEHYTNSDLNIVGGVFMESSNKSNLRYRCYGLDLLGQYFSNRDNENTVGFKAGLGCSMQIENEPWVYKDLPIQKKN